MLALCAASLFLEITAARANTDTKASFDLPAESLDKALRDLAIQAKCNISYEPALVAGLKSPAIKGAFNPMDALSMLLSGTPLKALSVNADTIRVVAKGGARSKDSTIDTTGHAGTENATVLLAYAGPVAADGSEKNDLDEIVVTGSHIRGVATASEVIEIGREEIDRSGYTSVADLMLSVPQNFGGGINPGTTVNNANVNARYADNPAGASVPNLRGLGPGSTLTLIDGHRMAAGLAGGGADISSIPIDAIERIDVVTDSASAIYGSDAVAGVVNVILKKDYDGAKTSLSYGYAPEGGGDQQRASQMFGTSWSSGHLMVAYEHLHQDILDAKDRDFTSSSASPYSLLPETRADSVTAVATQKFSDTMSAFVDGLYVHREADEFNYFPTFEAAPIEYPTTLQKFAVAAGFDFDLLDDWKAGVVADVAEDNTSDQIFMRTVPVTPESSERLLGTMRSIEANANGGIGNLPGGPVRLAVGAGYRKESFSDAIGPAGGVISAVADGDRDIRFAFGELSVPLVALSQRPGLNSLDLVISARNEHYSDFGGKTVPKIGVIYAPASSLRIRSTWGQAFRAPNLYDTRGVPQLVILDLPGPGSASAGVPTLIRAGGNPGLEPETADALSVGADYSPEGTALKLSSTLFDIKYRNRLSQIANLDTALTDPLNAYFVTPSPSAAFAESVVNGYSPGSVINETGAPFAPGSIAAVVDYRLLNVATQTARGADLSVNYRIDAGSANTLLFLNGTYLDLTQQNTPGSPQQTLSGFSFYPPKFRIRGGATWKISSWAATGTINYLAHETNNQVTPIANVGSWTTVDSSLRYTPQLAGFMAGVHVGLSVLNLFNRNPPPVLTTVQGLNYDSSNASPLGRIVTLQVSKEW